MYGDSHCDCESQRINSIKIISQNDGIFVHLPQEAQGWGLHYKLKELELQVSGRMQNGEYVGKQDRDSAQKMLMDVHDFCDNRSYAIVAKILKELSLDEHNFLVITDSDKKVSSLNSMGIKSIKYSDDISTKINTDNVSEYLIKICNSTHNYDEEIISSIIKIIAERKYNERTLLTFVNIIDKIRNDSTYQLDDELRITNKIKLGKSELLRREVLNRLEKLHDEFEDMQIMVKEDVGSNELRDEDIFRINEKIKDLEKQILYVIEG